jgi:type IV pilus assembly protein PilE
MMTKTGNRRAAAPGFTLVEVMVVVIIVGVLAAIAIPSYTTYIKRGQRSNASAILMETAGYMSRYLGANDTYVGGEVTSAVSPKGATGTAVKYNVSFVADPTLTKWTVQAVPANNQVGDECGTLTLDQSGAQTPLNTKDKKCW